MAESDNNSNVPNSSNSSDGRVPESADNTKMPQRGNGINPANNAKLPNGGASQGGNEEKRGVGKKLNPQNIAKSAASGAAGAVLNNEGATGKAARATQKAVEFGKKVANTVAKSSKVISFIGGLLANPVTWIVTVVIIVVIAAIMGIFATVQTIGKNDTSDGCYGIGMPSGGSTIVFEEGEDVESRANKMMTWLLEQPSWEVNDGSALSKEQAAGMVGNFIAESGLDPTIIEQSAPNVEHYKMADNDRVDVWTKEHTAFGKNIGLGMVQWTWNPGRAGDLINKARETGTQWYEVEPQLELMKDEMNGAYAQRLKSAGFTDSSGKDAGELAIIFHDIYEASADTAAMKERRAKEAKKILSGYTGGATGGKSKSISGGSCGRGSSLDMSTPIKLALSIAWPVEDHSRAIVSGFGKESAKPEYLEAKESAMEIQAEGGPHVDLYASCDRVVSTIIINTIDKEIPWGNVDTQLAYFDSTPEKWEEVPMSDRQPGDVLINHHGRGTSSPSGTEHVVYYIGDGEAGADTIVQGSYLGEVANVQSGDYIVADPGYRAFRFVGTPDSTGSSLVE